MNFDTIVLLISGIPYACVVIKHALDGDYPISLIFLGYVVSTAGYIWMTYK